MTANQNLPFSCIHRSKGHFWILGMVLVIFRVELIEAKSSPAPFTVMKGSSVWLQWAYTYEGDGNHGAYSSFYNEQVIGFNSTSNSHIQILAKRIGQNGTLTLQSPTPAPFNGRVEVISSNSTLAIHRLQYNDSSYQLLSTINVTIQRNDTTTVSMTYIEPTISITINGIPGFIVQPPSILEVNEGSNLSLTINMDGNPKPSASFKWRHLDGSLPQSFPTFQLYPFVYWSTYSFNNIDASYCGRELQSIIQNSFGFTSFSKTNVTVLLKLDKEFGLKSGNLSGDNCIEVRWNKAESGACFVKYDVTFKNASGHNLHTQTGHNIGGMNVCNLAAYSSITDVQLVVSFKSASRTVAAKVSRPETTTPPITTPPITTPPITTPPPTTATKECKISSSDEWTTRDSAFIAVIGVLVIIIIILLILYIKQWRKPKLLPSETSQAQSGPNSQQDMVQYMDLQTRSNENESSYSKLQRDYEEVGQKNPHYVNA